MRIAISAAPGAGVSPIHNASERTSAPQKGDASATSDSAPPLETSSRASEALWTGSRDASWFFSWIIRNRFLVLGLAVVVLLAAAALLPAPHAESTSQLTEPAFPGIGIPASPGRLAAVQLPSQRPRHAERSPLSPIVRSTLPATTSTAGQNLLVGLDLPAGVTATLPAHGQEGQQSFRSLLLAFALAVFLVYLVTASQVESLLNPISILFTVPMGLIAAAWGLYATGGTLNAVALIGTILLAGILVNNAIVLIDAIKNARARGTRTREAMIQASRTRVQPIMITSIGTVLGLLPMAIGVGESFGIRRPMTITVIAGVAVATFLVAVAAPVLYTLLEPRANKTT